MPNDRAGMKGRVMSKVLNGWTDHPFYKLLAPLIPVILIGAFMFWGSTGQAILEIKAKINSLCGDIDEFKKNSKELTVALTELNTSRNITNYRLEAIEKRLDKRDRTNQ